MAATITTQPVDSSVAVGSTHTFTVAATTVGNPVYRWVVNGVEVDSLVYTSAATATFTELAATTSNSYSTVYCVIGDDNDNVYVASDTVLAISLSAESTATRHALVFNYDDNNFTWKDPLVEIGNDVDGYKLYDIAYETYGFTPGWQERWEDYKDGALKGQTWADNKAATPQTAWSDTFSKGESKELMQVSNGTLYAADKVGNRKNSLKRYYVERTQMDLDDLVPEWTTNKVKQIKQFNFHMQSDQRFIPYGEPNSVDFFVGWSTNLMDDPAWKSPVTIDLKDNANGGAYKVDYRTSGRYLSMAYDLTNSVDLAFTGGDIDANQVAGR